MGWPPATFAAWGGGERVGNLLVQEQCDLAGGAARGAWVIGCRVEPRDGAVVSAVQGVVVDVGAGPAAVVELVGNLGHEEITG